MAELTSRHNPKLKLARSLHQRKARRESGLFLVEGVRHTGELLAAGWQTEFVCFSPDQLAGEFGAGLVEQFERRGVPVFAVTPEALASIGERDGSAGVIAVARQRAVPLADLDPRSSLSVALVSPQDPGNVGSILRTMDAVEAGALLLLDGGADPWQPAAVRASMGALFWHPVVQTGFAEFAAWAAGHGLHVYGTSARATSDYRQTVYEHPAVLLLGSEREGLSPRQAAACERLVRIPMGGRGTSLNLAVAAGVLLYGMGKP
jgi:TrmH family RNA methyltransferase